MPATSYVWHVMNVAMSGLNFEMNCASCFSADRFGIGRPPITTAYRSVSRMRVQSGLKGDRFGGN